MNTNKTTNDKKRTYSQLEPAENITFNYTKKIKLFHDSITTPTITQAPPSIITEKKELIKYGGRFTSKDYKALNDEIWEEFMEYVNDAPKRHYVHDFPIWYLKRGFVSPDSEYFDMTDITQSFCKYDILDQFDETRYF